MDINTKPEKAPGYKYKCPRVCATCKHGVFDDEGMYLCQKHERVQFDAGDMEQWFHFCNSYKRES